MSLLPMPTPDNPYQSKLTFVKNNHLFVCKHIFALDMLTQKCYSHHAYVIQYLF